MFSGPGLLINRQIILWIQPGYMIIAEGFHDLSVDCINTSFFLVNTEISTGTVYKKDKDFHIIFP